MAILIKKAVPRSNEKKPTNEKVKEERLMEFPIVNKKNKKLTYINKNQVKYEPHSQVNVTGAVIPETMALATIKALKNISQDVGDIDNWIADKLKWSKEELGKYLTSEQIDAVALGIYASENQKGLIVADQTGFGKGRIQAAIARYIVLNGGTVVFITVKSNLFSDFWRDINDINSTELFTNPLLLNADSKILDINDPDMPVVCKTWKKDILNNCIENKKIPDDTNFVCLSYSQLSRKGKKTDFIEEICKDVHINGDEIHNAVGDSTTSEILNNAAKVSKSTTFSSATFARDVLNLSFYDNVFPWLQEIKGKENYSPSLKRALAEESIRIATERGNIIRREHDLTNMHIQVVDNKDMYSTYVKYADKLAPILSNMAKLSRIVDAIIMEKNEENKAYVDTLSSSQEKKDARKVWNIANFGSRLSAMINQFLIALKVQDCVDKSITALKEGKKPVIVLERTMESLMRELSSDEGGNEEDSDISTIALEDDNIKENDKPPTYKEALKLMTSKLLKVNLRYQGDKIIEDWTEPKLVALQKTIFDLIEDFPDLSLSPIDDIKEGIEKEGENLFNKGKIKSKWVVDEISARNMCVKNGKYETIPSVDRNIKVSNFQNGKTQVLILTRAASTGLSLHDSEKCKDHGVRVMIMLDKIKNILEYVQMLGRVWRRGQITEPEFLDLVTGLPFEWYIQAVNNKKMSELNASVTGSGSATFLQYMEDPMNILGNEIAYEILSERKKLASIMGISLNVDKEQSNTSLFYVGKIFRRLSLLPTNQAEMLLKIFYALYEDRKKTSSHLYENKEMEDQWTPVKRELLIAGDNGQNPIYSDNLYLTTIRCNKSITPISSQEIKNFIKNSKNKSPDVEKYVKKILELKPLILENAKASKYKTILDALKAIDDNAVKIADKRLSRLLFFLRSLELGKKIIIPGSEGELLGGILVGYEFPDISVAHLPRNYTLHIALPGEEGIKEMSLSSIIRDERSNIMATKISLDETLKYFDNKAQTTTSIERHVLDGNPLLAIIYAHMYKSGSRMSYTNNDGHKYQGILLPKGFEKTFLKLPYMLSNSDIAASLIKEGHKIKTDYNSPMDGVEIIRFGNKYRVSFPQGKRATMPFENSTEIKQVCEGFQGQYNIRRYSFVKPERLHLLITALRNMGCNLYFEPNVRNHIIEVTRGITGLNNNDDDLDFSKNISNLKY